MFPIAEYFRSVEHVWAVWVLSVIMLLCVFRWVPRSRKRLRLALLSADERGAAYALPYVLVFPLYMFLMCLIIESSLVLIVKMGTMYSAYSAARSAIVWLNAAPNVGSQKIRLAGVQALVPFSSSNPVHAQAGVGSGSHSGAYISAYHRYSPNGGATQDYLASKYRFAERATQVRWQPNRPRENDDVTVTISYEMPLNVPGVGRVLGHVCPWGGQFYTCPITSVATLPNEGAKDADQQPSGNPIGIKYISN